MKKSVVALWMAAGFFLVSVAERTLADEDCDWFCEIEKTINQIWDWVGDTADNVDKLTRELDPVEETNKVFTHFRDNPPDCTALFEDITDIDPGFDPDNPTTDDFFTARLLMGLPLDYIKNVIPADTIGTTSRVAALVPYYTYLWCMAGVERDMINADTAVRDNYHLAILERLQSIDGRLERIEGLLNTPSGRREGWNK